MHCLYFIANIPQIMRLLSVYSQPSLLCALCKCVTEQTKRENTECVCPCLCGHTPSPSPSPVPDIAQGTKPHCYCGDQLHSSIRMGRHAETPPRSCSVVMAQLWEWGWRRVNVHRILTTQFSLKTRAFVYLGQVNGWLASLPATLSRCTGTAAAQIQ